MQLLSVCVEAIHGVFAFDTSIQLFSLTTNQRQYHIPIHVIIKKNLQAIKSSEKKFQKTTINHSVDATTGESYTKKTQ